MKYAVVFLALLTLCCSPSRQPEYPSPAVLKNSVVRLTLDTNRDGVPDGICTGFAVGSRTFMTAGHCVVNTDGSKIKVTADGAPCQDGLKYPERDIGFLACDLERPAVRLTKEIPEWGAPMRYIGYPDGFIGHYIGTVSESDKDHVVFVNTEVHGGASGSPLFNDKGEVFGIVVASVPFKPYAYAERIP